VAGGGHDDRWSDSLRQRTVALRLREPAADGPGGARADAPAPLLLFSHLLGGSVASGTIWGEAWAAAGFAVLHLGHPADDAVMVGGRISRSAMAAQLAARVEDVLFILDELMGGRRPEGARVPLDLGRIGMSGHSFGAQVTQAIAGQAIAARPGNVADPRIRSAVALSPSPPFEGPVEPTFAAVRMPFLSITGPDDSLPLTAGSVTPADRERPFRAMPPGDKYLLVLAGGTHANFSGSTEGFGRQGPSDHLRRAVIETTTAFWRWTLLGDRLAKRALDEPGAFRNVLKGGDRFERR
jgi:predicted dienelactone hydrolase